MLPPRLEMIVVALAAAAFMYQRSLGGSSGAATTIDGITFPADLQASGTKQVLCGGGTRLKFNVVKVYAVGLYFEPQAVTRGGGTDSLKPFVGIPAAELAKSSGFYDSLIAGVHTWPGASPRECMPSDRTRPHAPALHPTGKYAKTLLLQFHRSVDGATVAGAMKDSLAKKVSERAGARSHGCWVCMRVAGDQYSPSDAPGSRARSRVSLAEPFARRIAHQVLARSAPQVSAGTLTKFSDALMLVSLRSPWP